MESLGDQGESGYQMSCFPESPTPWPSSALMSYNHQSCGELLAKDPEIRLYPVAADWSAEPYPLLPSKFKFVFWKSRGEGLIIFPPVVGYGWEAIEALAHAFQLIIAKPPGQKRRKGEAVSDPRAVKIPGYSSGPAP